jgi:hypothetical protein
MMSRHTRTRIGKPKAKKTTRGNSTLIGTAIYLSAKGSGAG